MARKRKLDSHVIEMKLEEDQPNNDSSDGEEDISEDEEDEYDDDNEDEGEEESGEGDEDEETTQVEDEEEDFSNKESIRKLLEPFGKDQLIEILKEAALKNPSLLSRFAGEAEADPVHRNIFVHGLGWDVTSETLAATFAPFGKIEGCNVVTNSTTGRCKGYGFVLFRFRAAAQRALKEPLKKIGGRVASCQLAYLGPPAAGQANWEVSGRKVYVTNVGSNVNPERLLAFFSKFGEIEQGPLGYDPATGKLRGYALFIYKTAEGLNKALEEPTKYFEGCELHCRKAFEGSKSSNNNTQVAPVVGTETVPAGMQANDFALSYASAAALMGHNLVPGPTTVLGPSVGVGLLNPAAGLSPALSGGGVGVPPQPYAVGGVGIPPQSYAVGPVGSANRGSGMGVNSISPSVIGNYGSLAALQGMGAYQNSASSAAMRTQSGIGSLGTSGLAHFYGQ